MASTTLRIAMIVALGMLISTWTLLASPHIPEAVAETAAYDYLSLLQGHLHVQPREARARVASASIRLPTQPECTSECDNATAESISSVVKTDPISSLTAFSKVFLRGSTDMYNWPDHIFGKPKQRHPAGMWALHDEWDWSALAIFVVAMIIFDIYVIRPWFNSTAKTGLARTGPVVLWWIIAAMLFNVYIVLRHGANDAIGWLNGYLLEWMLSMDNVFVFHLVFKIYKTPASLHAKALFWGVFGAILFRMLFFIALNGLLEVMHWCRYAFGLFLVCSGFQAVKADDDDDLEGSWPVRFLSWLLDDRLLPYPYYDEQGHLWVKTPSKESGGTMVRFSMLVPVIMCLELTDILFAVDSVSAKVAQIPDQFLAYSSSVFAMFGLRSLFFIMEDLVHQLRYLKYGLCFILVFIGLELILADFIQLPATAVCIVLLVVFVVCAGLSAVFPEPEEESCSQSTARTDDKQ